MNTLDDRIASGRQMHGNDFDPADLLAAHVTIRQAFTTGQRVEVTSTYGDGSTDIRRGVVSTTTGRRPSFLLMHRAGDTGSSDLLSRRSNDRVTAIIGERSRRIPVQPGRDLYGRAITPEA